MRSDGNISAVFAELFGAAGRLTIGGGSLGAVSGVWKVFAMPTESIRELPTGPPGQVFSWLEEVPSPAVIVTPDGRIVHANSLFAGLLELPAKSHSTGKHFLRHLVPPDGRHHLQERWQRALTNRDPITWEGNLLLPSGHVHPVRWKIKGLSRKAGEDALLLLVGENIQCERDNERHRQALERALDLEENLTAIVDADGYFVYANIALRKQLGIAPGTLREHKAVSYLRIPEDMGAVRRAFRSLQAGEKWEGELTLLASDGQAHSVEATIHPFKPADGGSQSFIVEEKRRANSEDSQTEKHRMEALTHLANGMAHRFNNILAAVLGQTELLQMSRDSLPPDARQRAEKITHAALQGRDMIGQLTAYSRKQRKEARPVDLAPVLRSASRAIMGFCPPDVLLACDVPGTLPPVRVSPEEIHEAVLHLARNAIEAMRDGGGRMELRARTQKPGPEDENQHVRLVIEVVDNGVGIQPNALESIFHPFYTTKNMAESAGMGLAVVQGSAERYGGHVEVESERGRGSLFRIILPCREEPPDSKTIRPGQGERILLVEGDDYVARMGASQLSELGYQVVTVRKGEHAWDMLHEENGLFDLVIADAQTPGFDADEASGCLRDMRIPLLMLYPAGTPQDKTGATPSLTRPCTLEELAAGVRAILPGKLENSA